MPYRYAQQTPHVDKFENAAE